MKDDVLEIENSDGVQKQYNILFKFDELDNNEHYVVYTDYSKNENGNIDVRARQYIDNNGALELKEIKHEEVKDYIKEKLAQIMIEQ